MQPARAVMQSASFVSQLSGGVLQTAGWKTWKKVFGAAAAHRLMTSRRPAYVISSSFSHDTRYLILL
jgi:hypothetical protein